MRLSVALAAFKSQATPSSPLSDVMIAPTYWLPSFAKGKLLV